MPIANRKHVGFDVTPEEKDMIVRVARRYGLTQKGLVLELVRKAEAADPLAGLDEDTRRIAGLKGNPDLNDLTPEELKERFRADLQAAYPDFIL